MKYETIADIYSANELIRNRLLEIVETVANDATRRSDGEGWSIAEILEHLSIVEGGTLKICTKLVGAAKTAGVPGDGRVDLSDKFNINALAAGETKIEAPERVRPAGELGALQSHLH